eukprot:Gb_04707 [translate_table: standard]
MCRLWPLDCMRSGFESATLCWWGTQLPFCIRLAQQAEAKELFLPIGITLQPSQTSRPRGKLGAEAERYSYAARQCLIFLGSALLSPPLQWRRPSFQCPKFDLERMLSSIERYRVTLLPAVPPMLIALAQSNVAHKYDLSSLTLILTGGASLAKEIIFNFTAQFPHIQVVQGYGFTEACTVSYTDSEEGNRQYGSTGLLCSVVEAKVVNSVSGKPQRPNHKRRAPSIMKGVPKIAADSCYTIRILQTQILESKK